MTRSAFTLIELLIVIAVIAILSVVLVITLNPTELLRQSRDSVRISDLATINTALGLFNTDQSGSWMGTSSVVYVSIPDTTSTCANLGLPTLPTGYTYACATEANHKRADGNGWIPVNFTQVSFGAPLSTLPVDPVNTTSSRNYYTYVAGGSWEIAASLEAEKNKLGGSSDRVSKDGGDSTSLYETGTDLDLLPIDYGDSSLVGYWNFEEGTGNTTSTDRSGGGHNGTWAGTGSHYATGKVGNWAGNFNGTDDYVNLGVVPQITPNSITISVWVKAESFPNLWNGVISNMTSWGTGFGLQVGSAAGIAAMVSGGYFSFQTSPSAGVWYHIVATHDSSTNENVAYLNGVRKLTETRAVSYETNAKTYIGAFYTTPSLLFSGIIDDVRIYNRALSAAEILALYNATK